MKKAEKQEKQEWEKAYDEAMKQFYREYRECYKVEEEKYTYIERLEKICIAHEVCRTFDNFISGIGRIGGNTVHISFNNGEKTKEMGIPVNMLYSFIGYCNKGLEGEIEKFIQKLAPLCLINQPAKPVKPKKEDFKPKDK